MAIKKRRYVNLFKRILYVFGVLLLGSLFLTKSVLAEAPLQYIDGNYGFYSPDRQTCGSSQANTTINLNDISTKYGLHSVFTKQVGGNVLGSVNSDQSPGSVASVLKLIIADVFLSKNPDLTKTVTVTAQENYFGASGGDGSLVSPKTGQSISLKDALEQTLKFSSDTNANVLIDASGGLQAATDAAHGLGYGKTSILSYYNDAGAATIAPNATTVTELTTSMEKYATSSDPTYQSAYTNLKEETVKYGLSPEANKWGGTSKVTGNSAVFAVGSLRYIITMYVEKDWKGDTNATNPDSGATVIKNATNDILGLIQANPSQASTSSQCCQSSTNIAGSNNAEKAFNYYLGKGLSALQTAGLGGNLQIESGFDPTAYYPGGHTDNPSPSSAFGLVQWLGGRQTALRDFANSANKPITDLGVQLDFSWQELTTSYKDSVLGPLQQSTDLASAVHIVNQYYEGSGVDDGPRLSAAQDLLTKYGSNTSPTSGTGPAPTSSSCGSSGVIAGGFAFPVDIQIYHDHPDWFTKPHHDYPADDIPVPTGTAVYSISAGTIISAPTGGDCGTGVEIDAGSGIHFIYCHGEDGGAVDGAHQGDIVTAGQLIMHTDNTGHTTGPHLHVGIRINGTNYCPQTFLVGIANGSPPDITKLPTSGCTY